MSINGIFFAVPKPMNNTYFGLFGSLRTDLVLRKALPFLGAWGFVREEGGMMLYGLGFRVYGLGFRVLRMIQGTSRTLGGDVDC